MLEVNSNYLILIVIFINLLWYLIKFICKRKGYQVSFMYHIRDLTNFGEIIKGENSLGIKMVYILIIVCLFTSIFAMFFIF